MTLQAWLENKWLKLHTSSSNEISTLLKKIDRDVAEAAKLEITPDWRLAIAYYASLGCATVALRASGYRTSEGDGHHFRTIESLKFTLAPTPELVTHLQAVRKKRSVVSYDAAGTVSDTEVEEAVQLAKDLRESLIIWLKTEYPELVAT